MNQPESKGFTLTVAVNSISRGGRTVTRPGDRSLARQPAASSKQAARAHFRRGECILRFNG